MLETDKVDLAEEEEWEVVQPEDPGVFVFAQTLTADTRYLTHQEPLVIK